MSQAEKSSDTDVLRLATINVLNNPLDLEERYALLRDELSNRAVDVVLMQEVINTDLLRSTLYSAGYTYWAETDPDFMANAPRGNLGDCRAIASRLPLRNAEQFSLGEGHRTALHGEMLVGDRKVHLFTAHLAWGGNAEPERLAQAGLVDARARELQAAEPHSLILFAGDFNADDQSRTMRFMRGLDLDLQNNSTYWTDAYLVAGDEASWATTDQGQGMWGPATAMRRGVVRLDLIPPRRIDYIMTYGWVYGKSGCATSYSRFGMAEEAGQMDVSDHYGIVADILL